MRCAISIFGSDRPGIIASLTSRLASMGINIEDASMTLLQGHFAMILVVELQNVSLESVKADLNDIEVLKELAITYSTFEDSHTGSDEPETSRYVFHLSASDKPGIVAKVTEVLAKNNSNVVDCATRKNNETDVFTIILDVDIPSNNEDLTVAELTQATSEYGGDVMFQRVDEVDF